MPQCPQESSDSLFLLEVLVKDVHYSYSQINLDKRLLANLQETCVLAKFLHYPVMEIRQDPCGEDFHSPDIHIGAGKSCLFPLNKKSFACNQKLSIAFNVLRMNPEGSGSKCVSIGKAVVDLSNNFLQLMKKSCKATSPVTKCINDTYPLINDQCQTVGTLSVFLRLSCFGNQITTHFKMNSNDRESYVFKGDEFQDNLDVPSECFNVDCGDQQEEPCPGGGSGMPQGMQYPGAGQYPGMQAQYQQQQQQFYQQQPYQQSPYAGNEWAAQNAGNFMGGQGAGMPPGFGGASPAFGGFGGNAGFGGPPAGNQPFCTPDTFPAPRSVGGMNEEVYQYGKPWAEKDDSCSGRGRPKASPCASSQPCPPDITAMKSGNSGGPCGGFSNGQRNQRSSMSKIDKKNGNGIPNFPKDFPFCQRVHIGDSESEDTPVPEGPKLNLCDCDFPVPPGLSNPCPPPPKPKKKKAPCPLDVVPGDYCLRADCPCGLPMVPWMKNTEDDSDKKENKNAGKFTMAPGSVGMKGKQIIFQMNDKDIPLTEADKKFMASTQYKLGAIGDKTGPKNVIQVMPDRIDDPLADKDRDVFILKIGKKNDDSKKAKMEIELKTPKFEDKTPKKMDNETQWLDSDMPAAADKGGKGKGGKGGKGGKKGKK